MKNSYIDKNTVRKQAEEDMARMRECKTKEEMTAFMKGRTVLCLDNSDWHNEPCEIIEFVGGKERSSWKMKVKTRFGTFLELKASEVMIVTQTITTTESESERIKNRLMPNSTPNVQVSDTTDGDSSNAV